MSHRSGKLVQDLPLVADDRTRTGTRACDVPAPQHALLNRGRGARGKGGEKTLRGGGRICDKVFQGGVPSSVNSFAGRVEREACGGSANT